MTQSEFESRVKMNVSDKEFDAINTVYMYSDLDKDEFCKLWVNMNLSRVNAAIKARENQERLSALKDAMFTIRIELQCLDFNKQSQPYDKVLTKKQTALLEKANLQLTEETRLPFFTGEGKGIIDYHILTTPKSVMSILYEIEKFITQE